MYSFSFARVPPGLRRTTLQNVVLDHTKQSRSPSIRALPVPTDQSPYSHRGAAVRRNEGAMFPSVVEIAAMEAVAEDQRIDLVAGQPLSVEHFGIEIIAEHWPRADL